MSQSVITNGCERKLTTLIEHFATDPTVAAYRDSVQTELLAPVREWESGT